MPVVRYMMGSLAVHVGAVGCVWIMSMIMPDQGPLIDPDDVMVVSMAMPKSPDALPHRAERAPPPPSVEAPKPVEAPPPPPHASDLTVQVPDATPKMAAPKPDPKPSISDLFNQLDALNTDAPEGRENRDATSPSGIEDAPPGTGGSVLGDPEYAAYIAKLRPLFQQNFRPIPALTGQDLKTSVSVRIDSGGQVTSVQIFKSSGNPSWDQAALRAAQAVSHVPLPPQRLRARMAAGYVIVFEDPS